MATRKTSPKKAAATNAGSKVPATRSKGIASNQSVPKKQTAPASVTAKRTAPKKTSTPDKYTDPALRERIKAEVTRGEKGGRSGQWSARKAQLVAHEYEAEGGKYKGSRDTPQKSLTAWTEERWTTKDGKPARRKDGMHRYLPEKAWENRTSAERRSTEHKKLTGDKEGKQYVANTAPAVKARRKAERPER